MLLIEHKSKQLLVQLIKILIVVAAFYFIYKELADNDQLNWVEFLKIFSKNQSILGIGFILLLSFLNRYFEILKWQNLVASFKKISVSNSTKQVLAALTLGVFTPIGAGEYAGKALYFEKTKTSEIIFLNLICNGIQMVVTTLFGALGLLYLGYYSYSFAIFVSIVLLITLYYFSKNTLIYGYSSKDFVNKINQIPKKIHHKNIILGLLRYLVFTHQYYFLMLLFDVHLDYLPLISTIFTVYLLASIIPSFQFLDFALKGSIAIYFFKMLGVNEWIVVFITSIMWFLNVAVPVILGSFYVLNFKFKMTK